MFGQSRRKTIILLLSIFALLLLIYWKWPHPLSNFFEINKHPIGVTILLDDGRTLKQVELSGNETMTPLLNEIQRTRVMHLNRYKIIYLDNNKLYNVLLFSISDNGSMYQRICSFECDEAGHVYINGSKYAIVGHSELIPILEHIFEKNDAKLISN